MQTVKGALTTVLFGYCWHDGAMSSNESAEDVVELYITEGPPGEGELILRMSPEIAEEIRTLLDEQGLKHSRAAEFSSGAELALESVVVVASAGGAAALSAVVVAYIQRHDNKRVVLERDRESYVGYSEEDVKRLIDERAKLQANREAEWDRIKGQP